MHRSGLLFSAAGLLVAGVVAAGSSADQPTVPQINNFAGKLAPAVRSALSDTGSRRFIIQTKTQPTAADLAALRNQGAQVTRSYGSLPMLAVTAPGTATGRLAALPFVTRISPNLQVKRALDVVIPTVGGDVAKQSYGLTGKGVTVAVIDSGIAGSNDLSRSASDARSRVISGYDFTTAQATYQQNDACGHGTCVAGIIGGNAYNSSGLLCFKKFSGLAPEANILNLRVLGAEGNGDVGNVLAAIDWCIQRRTSLNIRVMNLSLGHAPGESYRTDPLCQAAERAWKAGILVVCAAGNSGRKDPNNASGGVAYGTIHSPGNDPYVLTVGATNDLKTAKIGDDTVATYSSRGPSRLDYVLKPDILAPGNKIISLRDKGGLLDKTLAPANVIGLAYYLKSLLGLGGGTSEYFEFSGTSMAAPVVSGAAALMLQKDPTLTPNDLKARLMKSAIKVWRTDRTTADIYSRGAGYLNIPRALQCTARVTSPALSPYCTRDGNRVTVHTEQAIWADQAVWSDQAIWADRKVDGDQAIWSDQAIWADQAVWSDQAIWADQAIWSDQAIWADISKVAIDGDR